ncbi:tyrosine-type recombinase/integrase [Vescimonas fastidiosa]|nr:tyrosine-type recombinase/integrase [Vescimonas fastidiosa]
MWMMIETRTAGAKGGRICTTDSQKTVSPGTVIHYHANIHKALKYAVKMDLIPFNPADKVERPKKQRYIADYYRQEELERLLEASKDHPYSLLIQMTAFYGLRRSEALGLKWDAIDFERDTITIKHIVTNAKIDGKCEIVCADRAKTKSSLRFLPLVSNIREKLLVLREQQKENRRDGEYLQPFGLQVQDHLGKCNGQYPDSAGHKADRLAHLSSCRKSCTPM